MFFCKYFPFLFFKYIFYFLYQGKRENSVKNYFRIHCEWLPSTNQNWMSETFDKNNSKSESFTMAVFKWFLNKDFNFLLISSFALFIFIRWLPIKESFTLGDQIDSKDLNECFHFLQFEILFKYFPAIHSLCTIESTYRWIRRTIRAHIQYKAINRILLQRC